MPKFEVVNIKYRYEDAIPVLERMLNRKWWMSRKRRSELLRIRSEIQDSRRRLALYAVECSEWRWKVGGSMRWDTGVNFEADVENGIRNRIGNERVSITDEDFKGV